MWVDREYGRRCRGRNRDFRAPPKSTTREKRRSVLSLNPQDVVHDLANVAGATWNSYPLESYHQTMRSNVKWRSARRKSTTINTTSRRSGFNLTRAWHEHMNFKLTHAESFVAWNIRKNYSWYVANRAIVDVFLRHTMMVFAGRVRKLSTILDVLEAELRPCNGPIFSA